MIRDLIVLLMMLAVMSLVLVSVVWFLSDFISKMYLKKFKSSSFFFIPALIFGIFSFWRIFVVFMQTLDSGLSFANIASLFVLVIPLTISSTCEKLTSDPDPEQSER